MSHWENKLSDVYQCSNCGGEVYVDRAAPIVKGDISIYKCIRCSNTGSKKWKLTYNNGSKLKGIEKHD